MIAFSGRQYRGAMRDHRSHLRAEAADRNSRTPVERTKRFRRTAEQAAAVKAIRKARRAGDAS